MKLTKEQESNIFQLQQAYDELKVNLQENNSSQIDETFNKINAFVYILFQDSIVIEVKDFKVIPKTKKNSKDIGS